jgi:hypothetical protein
MSGGRGDERRTIDELQTRYTLEPELQDIYVEGTSDAALISWYLSEHLRSWRVYPISSVEVPDKKVLDEGLDLGERGRVVTLGKVLEEAFAEGNAINVICLADLDFDAYLSKGKPSCRYCLLTDFTSLELYAFNARTLNKFLKVVVQATGNTSAPEVIAGLTPALVELGRLRAALHADRTGVGLIEGITRCCTRRGVVVKVDLTKVVERSINSSPDAREVTAEAVLGKVISMQAATPGDARLVIHGVSIQVLADSRLVAGTVGGTSSSACIVRER